MKFKLCPVALLIGASLVSIAARADLYSADAAYKAQDFPHAFELYRELAELGQVEAQKNLASMYVSGEGVKRDNVLGYAWSVIAKENGGGADVQPIIDQLESRLTDNARARVAEVQAQFGKAAIEKRVLPAPFVPPTTPPLVPSDRCGVLTVVNVDDFYPTAAKHENIYGTVLMQVRVGLDGRAHNPRSWYSLPEHVFDAAGRRIAMKNTYTPERVQGVSTPCTILFKVRFGIGYPYPDGRNPDALKKLAATRASAEAGDPLSQLLYGLMIETRPDLGDKDEKTMPWFVKAAQAGLAQAQYLVGIHTMGGSGFERDEIKGAAWLQRSANSGYTDSMVALAIYLLRSAPQADSFATALGWLEKSATGNSLQGTYYLSGLLAAGPDATRRDPKRALELIELVMPALEYDPTAFEVRAAAQAMLGDFDGAQKSQKVALQKARTLRWDITDLQMRLGSYVASKPWTGDLFDFTY